MNKYFTWSPLIIALSIFILIDYIGGYDSRLQPGRNIHRAPYRPISSKAYRGFFRPSSREWYRRSYGTPGRNINRSTTTRPLFLDNNYVGHAVNQLFGPQIAKQGRNTTRSTTTRPTSHYNNYTEHAMNQSYLPGITRQGTTKKTRVSDNSLAVTTTTTFYLDSINLDDFERYKAALKAKTYPKDNTCQVEKKKMEEYARILKVDMARKIYRLNPVRNIVKKYLAFEAGYVMGIIREQYRRMMALYNEIIARVTNKTNILGITQPELKTLHVLVAYEWIHKFEMHITKMIDLLVIINIDEFLGNATVKEARRRATQEDTDYDEDPEPEDSKEYQMRQEVLERLNLKRPTTTRKFMKGWPNEDAWDKMNF